MSAASGPATTPAVCEHDWRYSMTSGGYICLKCKLEAVPVCSHRNWVPTDHADTRACAECGAEITYVVRPVAPTPAPPPVEIPAEISEKIDALLHNFHGASFGYGVAVERGDPAARKRELRDEYMAARTSLDAAIAELVADKQRMDYADAHVAGGDLIDFDPPVLFIALPPSIVFNGGDSARAIFDAARAATPSPRDAE